MHAEACFHGMKEQGAASYFHAPWSFVPLSHLESQMNHLERAKLQFSSIALSC